MTKPKTTRLNISIPQELKIQLFEIAFKRSAEENKRVTGNDVIVGILQEKMNENKRDEARRRVGKCQTSPILEQR